MSKENNIFLIGPMGAGKSTIGKQIAHKLNMSFFDSDKELERRTGADIEWIFDIEGEDGFRIREERIIKELTEKQGIVLATGGGSIKSEKTQNYLSNRGIVVYLKTTIKNQLIRSKFEKKRPLLKSKISAYCVLKKLSSERDHLYIKIADVIVNTDEKKPNIISDYIVSVLKKRLL